jgi:hypothetical protein
VWRLDSTDEAASYLARTTREVVGDAPIHVARMRRTGDTSFFGVGLPTVAGIMSFTDAEIRESALATLGWWHHSVENTLEKVDRTRLGLHLRVYARWMWELLTAPLLPFEYAGMAGRLAGRLGELAGLRLPDVDLAGLAARGAELSESAGRFDARVAAERARLAAGGDDQVATMLSEAMLELSRALVPITATVVGPYGQDRYGHAWQSGDVPALGGLEALAALPTDSEAFQHGWVAAVRARNRVADAVEQASAVASRALDRAGR